MSQEIKKHMIVVKCSALNYLPPLVFRNIFITVGSTLSVVAVAVSHRLN